MMNHNTPNLECWLKELGKAHSAGILDADQSLPWEAPVEAVVVSAPRRATWGLGVAAAVAFVLVGIWQLESLSPINDVDSLTGGSAVAKVDDGANTASSMSSAELPIDGDTNGDGVLDGDDIQGFLNGSINDPGAYAEQRASVVKRLLESSGSR